MSIFNCCPILEFSLYYLGFTLKYCLKKMNLLRNQGRCNLQLFSGQLCSLSRQPRLQSPFRYAILLYLFILRTQTITSNIIFATKTIIVFYISMQVRYTWIKQWMIISSFPKLLLEKFSYWQLKITSKPNFIIKIQRGIIQVSTCPYILINRCNKQVFLARKINLVRQNFRDNWSVTGLDSSKIQQC